MINQELHELSEWKIQEQDKLDYASGPEYDYYTNQISKPKSIKWASGKKQRYVNATPEPKQEKASIHFESPIIKVQQTLP